MFPIKIKDNIDLKELEKYGFVKVNILECGQFLAREVYCFILKDNRCFIRKNSIDNFFVEFYFDIERKFKICDYAESIDWKAALEIIYKLTKADFLELVEE